MRHMKIVNGLKYSKDHEWIRLEGNKAIIGITDFAQHNLGDLVYIELPEIGTEIHTGDVLSVVESIKAASDVYAPVPGTVIEVNEVLLDAPEKINGAPYESWIAVVILADNAQLDDFLDAQAYEKFCNEEV